MIKEATVTERERLISDYSDIHKDARGFRPRGNLDGVSNDTLEAMIADLHYEAAEAAEDERRAELLAVEEFEERLESLIASGAGHRETALRWLLEGEDTTDLRMLEWAHGLPHHHLG